MKWSWILVSLSSKNIRERQVPAEFGSFHKFIDHCFMVYMLTMSACQKAVRPLTRCLPKSQSSCQSARTIRTFTTTARSNDEATTETVSFKPALDPLTVTSSREERKLMKSGVYPIGSRRRRAALRTSDNIPFKQLPYQCFQEALKVLKADREEKLRLIQAERLRISNLAAKDPSEIKSGEQRKQTKLDSMRRHLEYLKIQADINDPLIKKRFEDGEGMQSIKAALKYFSLLSRGFEQAHLQISCRQEMARISIQGHRAANTPTCDCSRCPSSLPPHSRSSPCFQVSKRSARRIRRFSSQRGTRTVEGAGVR